MKIYSVYDKEFTEYGRIIEGIDPKPFMEALEEHTPCPEGTDYVPEEEALQNLSCAEDVAASLYGGIPAEFGWCNGHNTKLNCFEYHRSSEFNLGSTDFILLVAKESEVHDFKIESSVTKAFKVPKGVLVEIYSTTLHYAPCQASKDSGFRVMVVLPKGSNVGKPAKTAGSTEDPLLRMTNKWLIAHKDTPEAKDGAHIGIIGENIDIKEDI